MPIYITPSKLYSYLQCRHRVWRDVYGPQEEKLKEANPFVEMLWEKGIQHEEKVVAKLGQFYRAVEKSLTIRYEGKKDRYFKYYETEMNGKLLRKYLFDYAGIQYFISVEFMKDKDPEFTELTNKLLATIIPHTIAPDQIQKILQ